MAGLPAICDHLCGVAPATNRLTGAVDEDVEQITGDLLDTEVGPGLAAEGVPKYVVATGGEPRAGEATRIDSSSSDYPQRVLDGTAICAIATGASTVYLYLIEDMRDAIASAWGAPRRGAAGGPARRVRVPRGPWGSPRRVDPAP